MKYYYICTLTIIYSLFILSSCSSKDISEVNEKPEKIIESIILEYSGSNDSDSFVFNYNINYQLIELIFLNSRRIVVDYVNDMITESSSSFTGGNIVTENILNDRGFISNINNVRTETDNGNIFKFVTKSILTYNDNGTLATKLITSDNNGSLVGSSFVIFVWDDGNLTKETVNENSPSNEIFNVNSVLLSYTEYLNDANLDINIMLLSDFDAMYHLGALMKKTGRNSRTLLSEIVDRNDYESGFWSETKYRFEYKFNDYGYVTEVKRYFSFSYSSLPPDSILDEILDVTCKIVYTN